MSKEADYIDSGIHLDRTKKVLRFTNTSTESAYIWKELLQDLKNYGVEAGLLAVTDD